MTINYPGIGYLRGYDKPDIMGEFSRGFGFGQGIKNEDEAKKALKAYADSLYGGMAPQRGGMDLAALSGGNALVQGSHDAAAGAVDPVLAEALARKGYDLGDPTQTSYTANVRGAESGGNDAATNPNSSATGRYQFLEGTWNDLMQRHPDLGLTPEGRMDPAQQETAMRVFTAENARALKTAGIAPNPGALYAAHVLGAGGAAKVLAGDPNSPVSAYVDPQVIAANPQLAQMSVGEFQQWANSKGGNGRGGYQGPTVSQPAGQGLPPKEVLQAMLANPETRALAIDLIKGQQTGASDLGLSPQYGVDANGNPVLIQIGKDGRAVQTQLPPGVSLSKEPIKLDAGTHWVLLDPITRQPVGQIPKNNEEAAFQTGFGTAAGKAAAERIDQLPRALAQSDNMLATIDGILADPALDVSTGWLSWMQAVPGTDQYRFGQRALQLQGQSFLQAFESLKGGGQITEVEGNKATQAIGRLSTAQSAEDYRNALEELKGIINAAKDRASQQAGGGGAAAPAVGGTFVYNPATGKLEPQ